MEKDLKGIKKQMSSAASSLRETGGKLDGLGRSLNELTANQNRTRASLGNLSDEIGELKGTVRELAAAKQKPVEYTAPAQYGSQGTDND